jgi:hypothetical protein
MPRPSATAAPNGVYAIYTNNGTSSHGVTFGYCMGSELFDGTSWTAAVEPLLQWTTNSVASYVPSVASGFVPGEGVVAVYGNPTLGGPIGASLHTSSWSTVAAPSGATSARPSLVATGVASPDLEAFWCDAGGLSYSARASGLWSSPQVLGGRCNSVQTDFAAARTASGAIAVVCVGCVGGAQDVSAFIQSSPGGAWGAPTTLYARPDGGTTYVSAVAVSSGVFSADAEIVFSLNSTTTLHSRRIQGAWTTPAVTSMNLPMNMAADVSMIALP